MTSPRRPAAQSEQSTDGQRESQAGVRLAKTLFEGIVEIAEDAIISMDSNHFIKFYNRAAEKTFGYIQAEVIGKPLALFLPQWSAGTIGQRREVYGLRKDGSQFPAEASMSRLELGNEIVFTVFLRDITERKQAAEALHASENFARGQVAVLKSTLDALARESAPERLLGHMLRTITEQFGAHSSSVWRRDEPTGMIGFEFAFEDGRVVTKTDPRFAGMDLSLPMEPSEEGVFVPVPIREPHASFRFTD